MEFMNKFMLDVATLDKSLFSMLEDAYASMLELEHIRDGLIYHTEGADETASVFFDDFVEWALEQIGHVFVDLNTLYKTCTEKELELHRLR